VLVKAVFSVDVVFVWLIFWKFLGKGFFLPMKHWELCGKRQEVQLIVFSNFSARDELVRAMNGAYSP